MSISEEFLKWTLDRTEGDDETDISLKLLPRISRNKISPVIISPRHYATFSDSNNINSRIESMLSRKPECRANPNYDSTNCYQGLQDLYIIFDGSDSITLQDWNTYIRIRNCSKYCHLV